MYVKRHSNTTSTNETVKLLLDSGANVNLQDKKGIYCIDVCGEI